MRQKSQERKWIVAEPGRLIGRGHPAGDFLEAYDWIVLEEGAGILRLDAHLPDHVRNPLGHMFGGFTPAYVDLVAIFTVRAGQERTTAWRSWMATTSMRIDYFEPVVGPRFMIEGKLIHRRRRMSMVETKLFDHDGLLLAFAVTTLREVPLEEAAE